MNYGVTGGVMRMNVPTIGRLELADRQPTVASSCMEKFCQMLMDSKQTFQVRFCHGELIPVWAVSVNKKGNVFVEFVFDQSGKLLSIDGEELS